MFARVLVILLALWMMAAQTVPSSAQVLPGLGGGTASSETDETSEGSGDLASAIRDAAAQGVSVIIIDGDGQVAATVPSAQATAQSETSAEGGMQGGSSLMKAQTMIGSFRETLDERLAALPNSIDEVAWILRETSPDGRIITYVEVFAWTLGLLVLSHYLTIFLVARTYFRDIVVTKIKENPEGFLEKMPFLVFRFLLGVLASLIAMALATVIALLIWGRFTDLSIQFTVTAIYAAFFVTRTVGDLWRMILSPFLSQYRLPRFSDRDAKRLYRWMWAIATYNIWMIVFVTWVADFGLNYNVYAIFYAALSGLSALANLALVLFNYRAISGALLGGRTRDDTTWSVRALATLWAPLLAAYFIFGWLKLAFDLILERPETIPMIAGAYGVFLAMVVSYGAMNYLLERYFAREREVERMNEDLAVTEAAEDGLDLKDLDALEAEMRRLRRHRPQTFEQLARQIAGMLALVAGIYAILLIWDPDGMVLGNSTVGNLLDVLVIVFIGYIVYHAFRIWIDSRIAEEAADVPEAELGDEGGAAATSRLGTLLPLFRGAILIVVFISITLLALLELGVNVSPLFAGAGIVGIAVGFGAQTLVRDIFSGAFYLIDDAFRKGEYIDIGSVKGTVEKISVRSFQLRHHLGALHTIPFGEIQYLTNYSRDWVIMKLPLRVTYDTDVEKVRKLIKKLGQQMLEDPEIGDDFIEPLKSQGVIEMQDSAMIIRVKFMTKPGDQWVIRKKVFAEIRALFEREGIKFAHREVTVRLADGKAEDLSPEQREALTGAVQASLEEEMLEGGPGSGDDR